MGIPSSLEYWHIGETHTRPGAVSPRRVNGSKIYITNGSVADYITFTARTNGGTGTQVQVERSTKTGS